jgi:hypothetical protein
MSIPEVKIAYRVRYRVFGSEQEFETEPLTCEKEAAQRKQAINEDPETYGVYLLPVHDEASEVSEEIKA